MMISSLVGVKKKLDACVAHVFVLLTRVWSLRATNPHKTSGLQKWSDERSHELPISPDGMRCIHPTLILSVASHSHVARMTLIDSF
jgi:hypothetical protein